LIDHPGLLLSLGAFLLVIGPLVFVHEMGHYLAGRWFGIGAETFSIGFGRELIGWTDRRGTRWKIGWLPLGGYVRFTGDMNPASQPDLAWLSLPPAERNRTFQAKPVWQRAIVVAAGPVVNFIVALLILAGFALAYGEVIRQPVVGAVLPGSPAAQAGLRAGDRIVSVADRPTRRFEDIGRAVLLRAGERVTIDYRRGTVEQHGSAVVAATVERDRFGNSYSIGRLGIASALPDVAPVGLLQAPVVAARQIGEIVSLTVETLGRVVTGRMAVSELHGPVGTAKIAGEQLTLGWSAFVFLLALVSINLGFINLLPVPMLDGGHLFFYAVEAVRRRPLEPRVQEWAFRGGLVALLMLMLVVTANDLGAFGLWKGLGRSLAGLIG
jgi:regulator of sigma E protease